MGFMGTSADICTLAQVWDKASSGLAEAAFGKAPGCVPGTHADDCPKVGGGSLNAFAMAAARRCLMFGLSEQTTGTERAALE
jgi:hypothetical protein